jgi:quinohemoprotein ethanol dehydrogenase
MPDPTPIGSRRARRRVRGAAGRAFTWLGAGLAALALVACERAATPSAGPAADDTPAVTSAERIRVATAAVDGAMIRANAEHTRDWPSHGLDYAETRFSRLARIDTGNVDQLGLVWSYNLESNRGVQATPLVIDGRDVLSPARGAWCFASTRRTGETLWATTPRCRGAWLRGLLRPGQPRRGGLGRGQVFVGTLRRLPGGLDAATGEERWRGRHHRPPAALHHHRRAAWSTRGW